MSNLYGKKPQQLQNKLQQHQQSQQQQDRTSSLQQRTFYSKDITEQKQFYLHKSSDKQKGSYKQVQQNQVKLLQENPGTKNMNQSYDQIKQNRPSLIDQQELKKIYQFNKDPYLNYMKNIYQLQQRPCTVSIPSDTKQIFAKNEVKSKQKIQLTKEEQNTFGDRILQGYNKIELLGKGGFALVWKAENQLTKQKVAIKQIAKSNMQSYMSEIRFLKNFFKEENYSQNSQTESSIANEQESKNKNQENIRFTQTSHSLKEPLESLDKQFSNGINGIVQCLQYDNSGRQDLWIVYQLAGEPISKKVYEFHPWSLDMWSVGALLIEILTGIPNWLNYRCRIEDEQTQISKIKQGIFAVKGQDAEKIIMRQKKFTENPLPYLTDALNRFDDFEDSNQFYMLICQMMQFNPKDRISPQDVLSHPFLKFK